VEEKRYIPSRPTNSFLAVISSIDHVYIEVILEGEFEPRIQCGFGVGRGDPSNEFKNLFSNNKVTLYVYRPRRAMSDKAQEMSFMAGPRFERVQRDAVMIKKEENARKKIVFSGSAPVV